MGGAVERLVDLVRRDLGSDDVRILEDGEGPEGPNVVACAIPGGRRIAVVYDAAPFDADTRRLRLELLVDSFRDVLARPPPPHPSPAATLHEELEKLAERAGAKDALVIDARSPIVWGACAEEMSLRPAYGCLPSPGVHPRFSLLAIAGG